MRTFWVESELWNGLGGTCGPCAAAMAESAGMNAYIGNASTPATIVMYQRMRAAGRCDAGGVSNGRGLLAQLQADGFTCKRLGYYEPMPQTDWEPFIKAALAANATVVVELAAGHNLRDAYSGAGMDAGSGLAYHFVCACEYHPGGPSVRAGGMVLPEGFWFADGDSDANNPIVNGARTRVRAGHVLQFYPLATLAAAQPCDLIAVYPRVAVGGTSVSIPTGWTWDGTRLTSPNGVSADTGMAQHIMADPTWKPENWIVRPEYSGDVFPGDTAIGEGSRLDCLYGSLGYVNHDVPSLNIKAGEVFVVRVGEDLVTLREDNAALKAQVADLTAKLATAQANVGDPKAAALVAAIKAAIAA